MNRKYCYLVNISHPDGCSEDYVINDFSLIGSCVDDYLSEYSCCVSLNPLEIHFSQVIWKGGSADGKKTNEG